MTNLKRKSAAHFYFFFANFVKKECTDSNNGRTTLGLCGIKPSRWLNCARCMCIHSRYSYNSNRRSGATAIKLTDHTAAALRQPRQFPLRSAINGRPSNIPAACIYIGGGAQRNGSLISRTPGLSRTRSRTQQQRATTRTCLHPEVTACALDKHPTSWPLVWVQAGFPSQDRRGQRIACCCLTDSRRQRACKAARVYYAASFPERSLNLTPRFSSSCAGLVFE